MPEEIRSTHTLFMSGMALGGVLRLRFNLIVLLRHPDYGRDSLCKTACYSACHGGQRAVLSEEVAWGKTDGGWQHLHGAADQGYSLEWHDFAAGAELDWASSFHPGGLEICLNLSGQGTVRDGTRVLEFAPLMAGFSHRRPGGTAGQRLAPTSTNSSPIVARFPRQNSVVTTPS